MAAKSGKSRKRRVDEMILPMRTKADAALDVKYLRLLAVVSDVEEMARDAGLPEVAALLSEAAEGVLTASRTKARKNATPRKN